MNIADRMSHAMPEWMELPKIEISNVADYLYPARAGTTVDPDKDFPNIAPPFKDAVFFWTFPKGAEGFAGVEALAYMHSQRVAYRELEPVNPDFTRGMDYIIPRTLSDVPEGYSLGWLMEMEFYDNDDRFPRYYGIDPRVYLSKATDGGWPIRVRTFVDEEGKFVVYETGITELGLRAGVRKGTKLMDWVETEVKGLNTIVLFALSLMHCKNVTLEKVHPEEKLAKKQLKKRGIPKITYHVILIKPMRNITRKEGGVTVTTEAVHALHICRGHFKDYRKGKGLFGKYQGIYWWESYARGSAEEGVVIADYEVGKVSK